MAYSLVEIATAGNTSLTADFQLLTRVDESFDRMLQAIDDSTVSVCLEMYIYSASQIADRFRAALVRACQRGVQVRILIDSLGSLTLTDSYWNPVREAGGEVRWFNPLRLDRLGIRNHR